MGLLVDGVWCDQWYDTASTEGRFARSASRFRDWVTSDGKPGPTGRGGFAAEADRYHLYVSLACPWAHRTLILRRLKGLAPIVSLSVVHWRMLENGWTFAKGPGVVADPLQGAASLHEIYTRADPSYTGRVTVPVLWDTRENTIVNNESAEILRMFNTSFDVLEGVQPLDVFPVARRAEIDAVNARIYDTLNNGVYKAGFATTQAAYEEALTPLFGTLDWLETRLADQRYLVGNTITEADIRLYTTLVRFDAVYVGHFKCNIRRIADYPNLQAYLQDLFQTPSFGDTTDFVHIKGHYYESHRMINPTGIVPVGPQLDLEAPHGRANLVRQQSPRSGG